MMKSFATAFILFTAGAAAFVPALSRSADTISQLKAVDVKSEVSDYFNTEGFNPWNEIYTEFDDVNTVNGEVVGAGGRIGSFLLSQGDGHLAPVPRDVPPGLLSPPGTPIFVAINAAAIPKLIEFTVEDRRRDLVLVVNGIHRDIVDMWRATYKPKSRDLLKLTTAVPHFGVLSIGGDVVTSPISPPTIAHGIHSKALADLLGPELNFQIVSTDEDMHVAATRKLLWASLLWLLCHNGPEPINVATVHDAKSPMLRKLVQEMLPAAASIAAGERGRKPGNNELGSTDEVMEYLESYSRSLPTAIVNLPLSIKEITARNGVFLSISDEFPQPLHEALIRQVAGDGSLHRCKKL